MGEAVNAAAFQYLTTAGSTRLEKERELVIKKYQKLRNPDPSNKDDLIEENEHGNETDHENGQGQMKPSNTGNQKENHTSTEFQIPSPPIHFFKKEKNEVDFCKLLRTKRPKNQREQETKGARPLQGTKQGTKGPKGPRTNKVLNQTLYLK